LLPATLEVAASAHGRVHVAGLARLFPAHTVHAQRSTAVVAANNCELQATDHYHIHRISVSLVDLLRPGSPGHAALRSLLLDPSANGITRFQSSMRQLAASPERQDTQVSVPVRAGYRASVTGAEAVHLGDGSRMNVASRYIIEHAELPIIDLLAWDKTLVQSLLEAAAEPIAGPASSRFLRNALRTAGRTDDLDLLDHGSIPRAPSTSVFGLFGVDVVDRASAVMVGSGNELTTSMKVHRGGLARGTIADELGKVRAAAEVARQQAGGRPAPGAADRLRPRPAEPDVRDVLGARPTPLVGPKRDAPAATPITRPSPFSWG
jgi:hypothetical protein